MRGCPLAGGRAVKVQTTYGCEPPGELAVFTFYSAKESGEPEAGR